MKRDYTASTALKEYRKSIERIPTIPPSKEELVDAMLRLYVMSDDYNYIYCVVKLEAMSYNEMWIEYNKLKNQYNGKEIQI